VSLICSPSSVSITDVRKNETSELLPVNADGSRSVDRSWDQSDTWRQMEDLHRVKAIGVANWSVSFLEELRRTWKIVPAVNQVELHPYLPQHELKKYCEDLGILLEAYSPLGSTGKHNESTSGLRVY
jgi:glycerol 2-dehydrogenase (NADP+)